MKNLNEFLQACIEGPDMYGADSRAAMLVGRLQSYDLVDRPEVRVALQVLSLAKMWRDSYTHVSDTAALQASVKAECEEKAMSILEAKAVLTDYLVKSLKFL